MAVFRFRPAKLRKLTETTNNFPIIITKNRHLIRNSEFGIPSNSAQAEAKTMRDTFLVKEGAPQWV